MHLLLSDDLYNMLRLVGEVASPLLIDLSALLQIIATSSECSTIQSSPQGPSNLLLHTSVSCWLLQENSIVTSPKAVSFLRGKL